MKKHLGRAILKSQKGIALIIALFAILVMTFLAFEISYNSHVEMAVGATNLDRLRAFYLAKSGVQISLLRVHIFRTVITRFGKDLGGNKGALDIIWSFPFAWPPMLPDGASGIDQDELKKTIKESFIEGAFAATIEGESGKIDINDLASPSKKLQETTASQLKAIIQNRLDQDDEWATENRGRIRPDEIVNNIADYVDEDIDSRNGGSEDSPYGRTDPQVKPTNRPLKTIQELHMVAGITDPLYNLIAPRVSVYGVKGINVNLASAEVIRSIDKQLDDEKVKRIIERRGDPKAGPFSDLNDFTTFVQSLGVNPQTFNKEPEIPLLFDSEINFRIRSTGIYKKTQREIVAIVYDFDKVKEQLSTHLQSSPGPSAQASPGAAAAPGTSPVASPSPSAAPPAPSGPPQIVFWQEF
ncbi:MAG: general secretion pathway protein GspK [Oligoflexia bacterium]|nr:general secretion pathway protein GspK [Oligoflexia bacterium]